MPRSNRGLFAAGLAGLVLLALGVGLYLGLLIWSHAPSTQGIASPAPYQADQAKHPNAAADEKRLAEGVAPSQSVATNPGEYQTPCDDGEYDNKSDLCAQWYAARAARDAANWAYWALLVGAVGAFGIVFALYLTIDSNSIARDTARKQLRAYLDVTQVMFLRDEKKDTPGESRVGIGFSVKNYGQTPASNVTMERIYSTRLPGSDWRPLSTENVIHDDFGAIAPGDSGNANSMFDLPATVWAAITETLLEFRVKINVGYSDVFDGPQSVEAVYESNGVEKQFMFVVGTRKHT